ncbi:MAG: hypothetical protein K0U50_01500 [Alphaproteobacteria bacterium]|nr:hypothetical protein [Alphaproteobacteria bacterium]
MGFLIALPTLPALIFGVLALASADSASKGHSRFKRRLLLTGASAVFPALVFFVCTALFARTDCSGGTTFLGCQQSSELYGEALFSASWIGLLSVPPTLLIGLGFAVAAVIKRARSNKAN